MVSTDNKNALIYHWYILIYQTCRDDSIISFRFVEGSRNKKKKKRGRERQDGVLLISSSDVFIPRHGRPVLLLLIVVQLSFHLPGATAAKAFVLSLRWFYSWHVAESYVSAKNFVRAWLLILLLRHPQPVYCSAFSNSLIPIRISNLIPRNTFPRLSDPGKSTRNPPCKFQRVRLIVCH